MTGSEVLSILGKMFYIFVSAVGNTLLRAWTITLLWTWFLVGLGLPPINILWAIGLEITVKFVALDFSDKFKSVKDKSEKEKDEEDGDLEWFIKPLGFALSCVIILSLGWFVHWLM